MKLLILLLSISTLNGFAQTFEGTITYANIYKSKIPALKDDQLSSMMGTTQEYYIKDGNYKSVFNGSFIKMQLYASVENRSYTLTNKDTFYWEDYGKNNDLATRYEVAESKETIMGVACDVLIVYTPKSKTYYCYNKKYSLNPDLYKAHAYGNWYSIISRTRALPLKTIYENDQFILTSTATSVTPMRLDKKLFEIADKNKIAPATW